MANKNIILSTSTINKQNGVVVLSLKKWQKMEKEFLELKDAMEAVIEGEIALREGKTRSFKEFLAELHAKN
ncbi:MAG: hypothetical protein A3D44_02700 [Candidatus Staskawiczbacteria bacterium RIFCSPHIGHO2_02_FULL_42_22]|uniref:Prevent-host-death protein n=1 Tax=Candidatus Staskawiczbacteria bacterium RIFCSPHIGHO2_02_FULL_42_22 TaxID=1802207 RepID=A0A1G2I3E1_9BACT|nr:MAG: hypothetical protein A3D44_02700 [Candidatus Staskawiczbacteria bacterium RIFCSPHIGHO2_02_FULL_42_22]